MKTVLLVSRCPPYPLHLGDRLIVWHLTRELSRRGYVIDLLALHDHDEDREQTHEYSAFFRHIELIREPPRTAFSVLRRVIQPSRRFAHRAEASFCPQLWRRVAHALDVYRYDLAHCFGSVNVYDVHPLINRLPNLITPYESHSLYLRSAARQGDLDARLRLPLARSYERFMFAPFQRAVVISPADKDELLALRPALQVAVIPNGIELERFRPPAAAREKRTLLFVGNFAYPPNQDAARLLARRILPAVRAVIPAARLQLVGVNPPDWMRALADEHIEVSGAVPDVRPYLARATAFVCPLRVGAGLKNKLLEALAMGIPVIATPLSVEGIAVQAGKSALIAPVDQIADRTVALLQDAALRERLSRQSRALIERQYSWARTATLYEELYAEICER